MKSASKLLALFRHPTAVRTPARCRPRFTVETLEDRLAPDAAANEVLIDFDELSIPLGSGVSVSNQYGNAVFSLPGGNSPMAFQIGNSPGARSLPNALLPIYNLGDDGGLPVYSSVVDMAIDFKDPVDNLKFVIAAGTGGPDLAMTVTATQENGTTHVVPFVHDGTGGQIAIPVDLSDYADITRIVVAKTAPRSAFVGYDDFSFTIGGADLIATSASINTAGGVDFRYKVSGVTEAGVQTALYWARGSGRGDIIGGPIATTLIDTANGAHGPLQLGRRLLGSGSKAGVPPVGATHLLVVVDSGDKVDEADEDNNIQAIDIRPDLTVESFEVNTVVSTNGATLLSLGRKFQLEGMVTVRNSGVVPVSGFTVQFYASDSATPFLASHDIPLFQEFRVNRTIKPGESWVVGKNEIRLFDDPVYMSGFPFSDGYYLGAQVGLTNGLIDAHPSDNFDTVDGSGDAAFIAGELALATTLIQDGVVLGGLASSHLFHFLYGNGAAVDYDTGSITSYRVSQTRAFQQSAARTLRYLTKLALDEVASGAAGAVDLSGVVIPGSVIGEPSFELTDSIHGPDLKVGIGGTQGSSGVADNLTMTVQLLVNGRRRVTLSGTAIVTLNDKYEFDVDDARQYFPDNIMRHLDLSGYATPFDVNIAVAVPVNVTFTV